MNKQELDERIKGAIVFETKHISAYEPYMKNVIVNIDSLTESLKPIIRDCIEAVTPPMLNEERYETYVDEKVKANAIAGNHPERIRHLVVVSRAFGVNEAIDTIQTNTKELLGDKQS